MATLDLWISMQAIECCAKAAKGIYLKYSMMQETAKNTVALRSFNDALLHDDRVSFSMLPVGDGMTLCRKKP